MWSIPSHHIDRTRQDVSSAIDFSVGKCSKLVNPVNPAIKHHTIPNRSIWCCYNTNHTELAVIVRFTTLVGTVVSHPLTPNCTRRCHAFTWTAPMLASTGSASLPSPIGMSIRVYPVCCLFSWLPNLLGCWKNTRTAGYWKMLEEFVPYFVPNISKYLAHSWKVTSLHGSELL